MNAARVGASLVLLSLLAGAAHAASLESSSVRIDGRADVSGTAAALFVLVEDAGVAWDATAASATLLRESSAWVGVEHPLLDSYATRWYDPPESGSQGLGPATLAGGDALPGAAMLVLARGQSEARATSEGLTLLAPQSDPRFDQGDAPDATAGQNPNLAIHESLDGSFVNATLPGGVVELRGDLTVILFGLAYDVNGRPERTGDFETSSAAGVAQGRIERHVLELADATLRLRAVGPLYLLSDEPLVRFDGTVEASDATGDLDAPGIAADGESRWSGESALTMSAATGRLALTHPVGAAGAPLARSASAGPVLALAAAALGAAALVAFLLWRRRARPDDLEVALLAMEERRWSDALAPLTRVAARRPGDAGVLIDRALVLEQLGRLRDAARAFESALRAAPVHAEAHFYYARTLARLQEREAGRVHLERALELDPRLAEMARKEALLRGL